jgi:predicted ArsR family transcriptional regulator
MDTITSFSHRQQTILRNLLHSEQGLTLDQLAEQLDISRNAVSQHTSGLEKLRYIENRMLPSSGGRPCRAYTLTDTGRELFPKQYALFSRMLLKTMEETLTKNELEKLLHTIGQEMAIPFKQQVNSSADRVEATRKIMDELGYETSTKEIPNDEPLSEIIAKNCVYHDVAMKSDAVCVLDRAIISTLLDATIEQSACMAKGDDSCRFCINTPPSE